MPPKKADNAAEDKSKVITGLASLCVFSILCTFVCSFSKLFFLLPVFPGRRCRSTLGVSAASGSWLWDLTVTWSCWRSRPNGRPSSPFCVCANVPQSAFCRPSGTRTTVSAKPPPPPTCYWCVTVTESVFTRRCEWAAGGAGVVLCGWSLLHSAELWLAAAATVARGRGGASGVILLRHPADCQPPTLCCPPLYRHGNPVRPQLRWTHMYPPLITASQITIYCTTTNSIIMSLLQLHITKLVHLQLNCMTLSIPQGGS